MEGGTGKAGQSTEQKAEQKAEQKIEQKTEQRAVIGKIISKNAWLLEEIASIMQRQVKPRMTGQAKSRRAQTTTSALAKATGLSQQGISLKLRQLAELRFVELESNTDGISVGLTGFGREELKRFASRILTSLKHPKSEQLSGILISGLGEGKYYMGIKEYSDRLKEILGYRPYKGTLNIKVFPAEFESFILHARKIYIPGFTKKERTFGGASLFPVKIKDIDCAIIIPDRTSHKMDVAEVISEHYLRGKLGIKDESKVMMTR